MYKVHVKLKGLPGVPLLMRNGNGADPLNPTVQLMRDNTSVTKKRRTLEHDRELDHLKWLVSIYFDDKVGPYIPASMVEAMARGGARQVRKGKDVEATLIVMPDMVPLTYDGPRDLDSLCADLRFVDRRTCKIGNARVTNVRPKFIDWALAFDMEADPFILPVADLRKAVEIPSNALGDYRPRFGRFEVTAWTIQK